MSRETAHWSGPKPERLATSRSLQTQKRESTELATGRWPELRIIRPVNYEATEALDWDRFLNHIGAKNYGSGIARSLGSMACDFVDAQAMGRMLAKKYRKAFQDRRRTLQVQRAFAKDFNQFVTTQEKARSDVQFAKLSSPLSPASATIETIEFELVDSAEDITIDLSRLEDAILNLHEADIQTDLEEPRWNEASFVVKGIERYGKRDLGVDLSLNEQLYIEWQDVRSYLIHDGLDVNLMLSHPDDKNLAFEPHATSS